jgi:hypothetical protein
VSAADRDRAYAEGIERARRIAERSREEAIRRVEESVADVLRHLREFDRLETEPGTGELALADAVAWAWDVLDDLAYGDWSQIDQQRARAALERIIEASDAVTPRRTSERAPERA